MVQRVLNILNEAPYELDRYDRSILLRKRSHIEPSTPVPNTQVQIRNESAEVQFLSLHFSVFTVFLFSFTSSVHCRRSKISKVRIQGLKCILLGKMTQIFPGVVHCHMEKISYCHTVYFGINSQWEIRHVIVIQNRKG